MIGLGSNRLTVCRRGGMSVTQAGRGGMEWLAGGRMPSWASPYSAQATAALKAQFPTQWPTIRDYGFAHPEIVGYMNAYAPEDAKIAYSLVDGIGFRGLLGDGNAYIKTGYIPTNGTAFEVSFDTILNPNATRQLEGWTDASGSYWAIPANNVAEFGNLGSSWTHISFDPSIKHKVRIVSTGTYTCTMTLDEVNCGRAVAMNREYLAYACYNFVGVSQSFRDARGSIIIIEGGVKVREMYPFIRKINGVDVCGMIDVLSGTFYQNAGSGSFTISETPSS